jgi:hypothetical protein
MKSKAAVGRKTQIAVVIGPETESLIADLAVALQSSIPGMRITSSEVVSGMLNDALRNWSHAHLTREIPRGFDHRQ